MPRPNPNAQHRPLVLIVCPSVNGYRLALAGGDYFEPIAEFPTSDEAQAAYRVAKAVERGFATWGAS